MNPDLAVIKQWLDLLPEALGSAFEPVDVVCNRLHEIVAGIVQHLESGKHFRVYLDDYGLLRFDPAKEAGLPDRIT